MKQSLLKKSIHVQADEKILAVVRKHWFILITRLLNVVLIGTLPFILVAIIGSFISAPAAEVMFLTSAWLLIVWMSLFTVWTNHYLDIWIVTDKRIVNIDQIRLFKRNVSTLRIERVQDIKVETYGFFATLFGFGNLQVQTAGPEAGFYLIKNIYNPGTIRDKILERVDEVTEHRDNLEFNVEKRPTQGV